MGDYSKGTDVSWELCTEKIGPAELLKLDDDYLKHLLIMPNGSYEGQDCDQFMWLRGSNPNKDEDCITPDQSVSENINSFALPSGISILNSDCIF